MKIKASWVVFVPAGVGALLLHLYYLFFIGGEEITQPLFSNYSMIINKQTEPEIIAVLAGILLLFSLIFYLADRETAPYCEVKKAVFSGFFLLIAGLLMGMDSAVHVMGILAGESSLSKIFLYALGLVTALLIAIIGMGLLIGSNITKRIRGLMLIPTIWAAVNLVAAFSVHRKEAPSFGLFDIFVWVALLEFIFYNTMVLCGIEIKNPVKSSFVWGFELFFYSSIYVISSINDSVKELGAFSFTHLVPQFMLGAFGLYALFFLMSMSSCMITKEQESKLETDGDSEKSKKKGKNKKDDDDDFSDEPQAAYGVGSTKYVTAEFEKIRMEKAAKKAKENTITSEFSADDDEDDSISTLDKIDQLIQELSEDTSSKK